MTFERVYKHITEVCPRLGATGRDPRIIYEWLAAGFDIEKDIIPAVNWLSKKSPDSVNNFYKFTGAIKAFHSKRIAIDCKPRELTQAEKDAYKAKALRFMKDRGVQSTKVGPQDFEWLAQYEKDHGRVEAK